MYLLMQTTVRKRNFVCSASPPLNMADQSHFGLDKDGDLQDVTFKDWTAKDLHAILQYYGVNVSLKTSNYALVERLKAVAAEQEVTLDGCLDILWSGEATAHSALFSYDWENDDMDLDYEEDDNASRATNEEQDLTEVTALSNEAENLLRHSSTIGMPIFDRRITRHRAQITPPKPTLVIISKIPQQDLQALRGDISQCSICHHLLDICNTSRPPTEACKHVSQVCIFCLKTHITAGVDAGMWKQLNCPTCDEKLRDSDLRCFADLRSF